MVDTEIPATSAPAPAVDAAPASVAPSPVATSAVSTEAAASSTPASVTAVAETAAPEAVETANTNTPSLLASEPAKEEIKQEVKPDAKIETKTETKPEVKTEEKKPEAQVETKSEVASELPKYEAFKLPEGFKADEKVMGEVSTLLGQLELAKGDHKSTQEIGQKLVDLHAAALTRTVQDMTDYYKQAWETQKADDFKALQKDKVLGGDNKAMEATARNMANFLAKNGGTKEEVKAFRELVQARGVDNALPIVRVLNNLKAKIEGYENESSQMTPGTKPVPSVSSHPGKGMMQKLYGKK